MVTSRLLLFGLSFNSVTLQRLQTIFKNLLRCVKMSSVGDEGTSSDRITDYLQYNIQLSARKLRKLEKKTFEKQRRMEKRKEGKRQLTDFLHYANSDLSDYYFEGSFRKVYPYYFTFKAYAKKRWLGRSIYDILTSEFNCPDVDVITVRCQAGDIQVNDRPTTPDYVFQDSDLLSHKVHRHELPVLNTPIEFIYEDDKVLVINKPASVPVHPCGLYTLNSLTYILSKEYGKRPLRFIHRLDRMTSGVLVVSKDYDEAARIAALISDRAVKKYYVCRVEGEFPRETDSPYDEVSRRVVVCEQPLGALCSRMGLHTVLPESEGGRPARTHFTWLATEFDGKASLVLCRLFTGRTHQIRIHLQYLGYPIVDDPLYNSTDWGELKGKGGCYITPREELIKSLSALRTRSHYLNVEGPLFHPKEAEHGTQSSCLPPAQDASASFLLSEEVSLRLSNSIDSDCYDCVRRYRDPELFDLVLQLHAYRYAGEDWAYTAPLPTWAKESSLCSNVKDIDHMIENAMKLL